MMLSSMSIEILFSLVLLCNCQRDYRSSFFILTSEEKDAVIASKTKEISSCFFQCNGEQGCQVVVRNTRTEECTVEESEQELNKEAGKYNEIWKRIPEISGKL